MAAPLLSRRALNRATLARQMLLRRETVRVATAVERLAGLQAQIPRPPFVALWSRIEGFRREHLIRAINRRDLVRGTLMRGTLHLVSRRDFLSMRPVIQPVLTRAMGSALGGRANGLDTAALVAAASEFFGERPRTFAELRAHLSARFTSVDERAMGYLVRMQLPLIQTPAAGSPWAYPAVADFALAQSWLGEDVGGTSRLDRLALRYLAAFGPATAQDLQNWSGLRGGREIFDALRPKLATFRDEAGRELFDLPKAPRVAEDVDAPVRFLPEFDSLLLGHQDRSRVIEAGHRSNLFTKNLLIPATFLVDGFVAGLWTLEKKGKSPARVLLKPFGPLQKQVRKAAEEEGEELARFLDP